MLQVNRRKQAREMKRLIGADMELYSLWPRTYHLIPVRRRGLSLFFYLLFTVHTFPAVVLYRLQTFLYEANFHPLATLVSRINHTVFGVTIGNHVRTTGGLQLGHGHVVIDGFTFLGDNVTVNPFVTIGIGNSEQNLFGLWGPVIGNNVHIGTGAKILGKVNIGDSCENWRERRGRPRCARLSHGGWRPGPYVPNGRQSGRPLGREPTGISGRVGGSRRVRRCFPRRWYPRWRVTRRRQRQRWLGRNRRSLAASRLFPRRAPMMPGTLRCISRGVVVPSMRSPLTTTSLMPTPVSCWIRATQRVFAGALTDGDWLVDGQHRLASVEVGHVACHKQDVATTGHQWERYFQHPHLRIAVEGHRVIRRHVSFQTSAGIEDEQIEAPIRSAHLLHHRFNSLAIRQVGTGA